MKFAKLATMSAIALTLSFSTGAFADSHGMAVGITPTMKKLDFEASEEEKKVAAIVTWKV